MHSSLNRLQAVFGFFTTVAVFVAALASLSVLLHPADDVTSSVELKGVQVYVSSLQIDGVGARAPIDLFLRRFP